MAEITAKQVNDLRAKTGLGMMQCKQLLGEAGGDIDKAIGLARKMNIKTSITERIAGEGRVFGARNAAGTVGALIELNCNTDFTAKSEPFAAVGKRAAQALAERPDSDVSSAVGAEVTSVAQSTGENVRIGKTAALSSPGGKVGLYSYGITGKIGVIMAFEGNVANVNDELVTDVGGHIAFARPLGLDRTAIPADVVAKEREIAVEQAKATGKPQQIAEKIAEGKLNAFFAERALLDQEFFNAQKFKGSISAMLKAKGVTLKDYRRVEVGQA
jgi:elongation factor Ts